MKDFILAEAVDMSAYQKKLDGMTLEKLQKEKEKVDAKMHVNLLCLKQNHSFAVEDTDISNSPDEKNRIYTRMKVRQICKFISGLFGEYVEDFSAYWEWINQKFIDSTQIPGYAYAKLEGKRVTFADKLSVKGMVAYKRYLLLIYKNFTEKNMDLELAVFYAITEEREIDKQFDRAKFYSPIFLPKDLQGIYKNLLRDKLIKEALKEKSVIKQKEIENEKED